MERKTLIILLAGIIVILIVLSYQMSGTNVNEKQNNESNNDTMTNSSNVNKSVVIPLERPPFLPEEKP